MPPNASGYGTLHHVADHAVTSYLLLLFILFYLLLLSVRGWDELWNEENWECNTELWGAGCSRCSQETDWQMETDEKKITPTEEEVSHAHASLLGSKWVTCSRWTCFGLDNLWRSLPSQPLPCCDSELLHGAAHCGMCSHIHSGEGRNTF